MAHVTSAMNRLNHLEIVARPNVAVQSRAATSNTTQTTQSTQTATNSAASDFQKLFSSTQTTAATSAPAPATTVTPPPTPQSAFGDSPWMANPVGKNPDGSEYSYNPIYFATPQTAGQVAQMLGGTVVTSNEFTAVGSPFVQQQPNMMVQMPDGRMINAGLVASLYTHGYPQSYIDGQISNIINGTNI